MKVSVGSTVVSPMTVTGIVRRDDRPEKLSDPEGWRCSRCRASGAAVRGGEIDGDRRAPGCADSVTVKFAVTVPALPSVTVASLIVSVGGGTSSVTIVPTAAPSPMIAPTGDDRVTVEGLGGLQRGVADDRDRDGRAVVVDPGRSACPRVAV